VICSLFGYDNDDDAYDYDMGDDDDDDNYDDMRAIIDFNFILAYFVIYRISCITYISYTNIPALISCAPTLELNETSSRTTYHNHQYIHIRITLRYLIKSYTSCRMHIYVDKHKSTISTIIQ
jgi:hypothetical protein